MFLSRSFKKITQLCLPLIAIMLMAFCGTLLLGKTSVFAEQIGVPSYLRITTQTASYGDNDTVFLDEGESLSITLGKPLGDTSGIENGTNATITNQTDIGDFAVAHLDTAFALKINNVSVLTSTLQEAGVLKFVNYIYQPTPASEAKTFMWLELDVDLAKDIFPSGEYAFTFTNFSQNSGTNFSYTTDASFSFTLFIFETTEYFASDAAKSPNATFENVETSSPNTVTYRNYFYFNYSNLNNLTKDNNANYLPKLSFDASKFELNISKTVSGNKYACIISKFNQNLITLSETTNQNFITATYNAETNVVEVIFNDLGEYVLEYNFIFERYNHEKLEISSNEILGVNEKSDALYIYGFQMFFNGVANPANEFKTLNDTRDATKPAQSADITYLVDGKTDAKIIKSSNPQVDFEDDDQTIKDIINAKNIKPVSTNQPAVILSSNANINSALSQFYTANYNNQNGAWEFDEATPFTLTPFTETGTYLLKVVYNYDYYYTTTLSKETQFVQYFFFTIDSAVPNVVVTDALSKTLGTYAFTKHNATIKLEAQSAFNSSVVMEIYSKSFTAPAYTLMQSIAGTDEAQYITLENEAHYQVKLVYGKNQNKSKTTYFTIDKTEITGAEILNIALNAYTNQYDKNEVVDFFTSQSVIAQWNEKASGAPTTAYFKYVPFTATTGITALSSGITTTYMLNLDKEKVYDKASYTNAKNSINSSNILSNQGLYIIYITDAAGHEKYITFCIDKSPMQVIQRDAATAEEHFVMTHNTVSSDQILSWGDYKLISLNCQAEDLDTIADPWIKDALLAQYSPQSQNITDNIHAVSSNLYFTVEICDVYALQTGTSLKLITDNEKTSTEIKIMAKTSGGVEYANEITYGYFFIDEANPLFKEYSQFFGQTSTLEDAQKLARSTSKAFQITTTTDASNATVVVNPTQNINDVSMISAQSTALLQAGFADSKTDANDVANLRTKYHFATGQSANILSYRIKLAVAENLNVSKITLYYYAFTTDSQTGAKALGKVAIQNVIYDAQNPSQTSLSALSGEENDGYYAFNINVGYSSATNQYRTLAGKYVIVREYDNPSHVNQTDFSIRENVFVVDHEDIVSSPELFNGTSVSAVGGGIFINVLDGSSKAVQFTNIYSAKNLGSTYILQTNKLPVVVYVPVAKYGVWGNESGAFFFNEDESLAYYLQTDGENLIRFAYQGTPDVITEKSALSMVFFGDLVLTENFEKNKAIYKSADFDLSVSINSALGQTILSSENNLGYFVSNPMISTGAYFIKITQNALNGLIYPNAYGTFKFSYQIIESPPTFVYAEENAQSGLSFDSDKNGVFYTNAQGKIKVMWTDPADTRYFAKVDTTAGQDGNTKIYYWFTTSSGTVISANTFVKTTNIFTDLENPNTHYFLIDISAIPENSILNVYMQNECGISTINSSELLAATSATNKLMIDRTAPSELLESFIEKTTLENITFGEFTRTFVTLDGQAATNNQKMYSVPVTNGALAKYAFLLQNTENAPIASLFQSKDPIGNLFTEGYYYNIQKVADISSYSLPNLASVITAAKAYQNQIVQTFTAGSYYEITEIDLAGNASIYLIFVANGQDHTVLQYTSEATDVEQNNSITFNKLQPSQDVYAKSFLKVTNLDLYGYKFLQFSLDGEIYFMSSALQNGQAYKFSSMTTQTSSATIVNIAELLNFTAESAHTLVIKNTITGQNITFNLYASNAELSYHLLSSGEGIQISANGGVAKHFLQSITISSYNSATDKYVVIYEGENAFASNSAVAVSGSGSTFTFQITHPELAYSYVFFDNYGNKYAEHHTVGSFVLGEDQKVKNHLGTMLITQVIEGQQSTNNWFVGKSNIVYNYSSADYFAYIKIYTLKLEDGQAKWVLVNDALSGKYGIAISSQSNYTITDGANVLCSISTSPIHSTVKQLMLYAPAQNLFADEYTGSAIRFEITLVDQYDAAGENIVEDRVLINNLAPILDLKDKNYDSVFMEDAIYTEQLTILVPALPNEITTQSDVAIFMFDYASTLTFNDQTSELTSGTIVEDAGTYVVKIFAKINENLYLLSSTTFVISESGAAFFEVLVRDGTSGTFVKATTTGGVFTYGNIDCYQHYIVNDEHSIFLNKNQYMQIKSTQRIDANECTTYIYQLSNFDYASTYNISPYQTTIAVSYIPKTTSIITNSVFAYELNDGISRTLSGTNAYITITQSDADVEQIIVKFNSFYAIPENVITATITSANQTWIVKGGKSQTTTFVLKNSGDYTIKFTDLAGNAQLFTDTTSIEQAYFYKIRFIKGVAFLIDGNAPIQNAIYNDQVSITLDTALSSVYDVGGKPSIVVYKNDQEITVKAENGAYNLTETGFYRVFFNARVNDKELRQEAYEFLILSSKEFKSVFEFSEYGNYEIAKVVKNDNDITPSLKRLYGLNQNDPLKTISISLYDEKTGAGTYKVQIKTNSGLLIAGENGLEDENFEFEFKIKAVGAVPINVSINEGESTTKKITVEFNAYDLYQDLGECKVVVGNQTILIDQEYLDGLNGNYYCNLPITETGTYFVQVYNSSDSLLYSYKVTKTEPLNTVSILLIVGGVLATAGLTVTIILLRRRMKIK